MHQDDRIEELGCTHSLLMPGCHSCPSGVPITSMSSGVAPSTCGSPNTRHISPTSTGTIASACRARRERRERRQASGLAAMLERRREKSSWEEEVREEGLKESFCNTAIHTPASTPTGHVTVT